MQKTLLLLILYFCWKIMTMANKSGFNDLINGASLAYILTSWSINHCLNLLQLWKVCTCRMPSHYLIWFQFPRRKGVNISHPDHSFLTIIFSSADRRGLMFHFVFRQPGLLPGRRFPARPCLQQTQLGQLKTAEWRNFRSTIASSL